MRDRQEKIGIVGGWKLLMTKKCIKCGQEKHLELFVKNKTCKNGRSNVCKECQNKYSREYRKGNEDYLLKRRIKYYENEKTNELKNRIQRKQDNPLKIRCQYLRAGMRDRARKKNLDYDKDFFTVEYLMKRLEENPNCECCKVPLDIGFKEDRKFHDNSPSIDRVDSTKGYIKGNVAILCWRCNKHKQDSTSEELRIIADFMDNWKMKNK